jgi:hypothetical protein
MTLELKLQSILKQTIGSIYGLVGLGVTADAIDLSDAPGSDLSLDDIFGETPRTQTTAELVTETPQAAATSTTQSADPVIKTKTGTVYKTLGDAVEGIEHKDALIAQLREQVKQNTGRDPLVAQRQSTQPVAVDYTQQQDKYFEDIADAVSKKDTAAYMRAQQKLIWDSLGPLAPTITSLSRANAERVVSEQIPDFKGFLGSEQYEAVAKDAPLLADAIRSAEGNPAAAQQLPELYRVAYLASQGRRVPELLQSARNETPPIKPRPTVQSTQLAPPPTTGVAVAKPDLNNPAGRKAIIEQMEAGGVLGLKW